MNNTRKIIKESKTLVGPFPAFNIEEAMESPHELFLEWFQVAIDNGVHEPHAMTLSTTDHKGYPDARVLILKDLDEYGWYFASSAKSNKGKQIKDNPRVALTFYWSVIGRQVRVRGKVVDMGEDKSSQDFLNRGHVARAIALIDKQSSILEEQSDFEEALIQQLNIVKNHPTLVSPSWTLYRVVAEEVEFWQGNEERKHVRLRYVLEGDKWVKNLLWS